MMISRNEDRHCRTVERVDLEWDEGFRIHALLIFYVKRHFRFRITSAFMFKLYTARGFGKSFPVHLKMSKDDKLPGVTWETFIGQRERKMTFF